METLKTHVLSLIVAITLTATTTSFANSKDEKEVSKTTMKAREAVAKAAPDDWYTLAKNAEKCIQKKVNLKEASAWLDRSLAIKETAYNLEVKGDYYRANNLPEKAIEFYVKTIEVGKKTDGNFDAGEVQAKIMEIRNQK